MIARPKKQLQQKSSSPEPSKKKALPNYLAAAYSCYTDYEINNHPKTRY
jgi:hypothetical protein